ncbi:MAG: hypothetical protein ACP5H9_01340 [Candidatus Woesearchaeota archaeon]
MIKKPEFKMHHRITALFAITFLIFAFSLIIDYSDFSFNASIFKNKNSITGYSIYANHAQSQNSNGSQTFKKIRVLNPKSNPVVFGEWVINFTTNGIGNLTIRAINGTLFEYDVKLLKLYCDGFDTNTSYLGAKIFFENWSCSSGSLVLLVLTSGKHYLEFNFLDDRDFAENYACNESTMPVINDAFEQYGYEGILFSKNMDVSDPSGYPIVYYDIYVSVNDTLNITINKDTGLITFFPEDDDFGEHIVQYLAKNNESCLGSKWITIIVYDRPNITAHYPEQLNFSMYENSTQNFNVTVTDRNSDNNITYSWYLDYALVSNESSYEYAPDFCSFGEHNLTLIVKNSYNLTANLSWNLSVLNVNRPPYFIGEIPNFSWNESSNLTNAFNLFDYFNDSDLHCSNNEDNLSFNYSIIENDYNVSVEINQGNVSFIPVIHWFGNRTIVFYAFDSYGAYNLSNNITLEVIFVNDPPIIGYNNFSVFAYSRVNRMLNFTDYDLPYDTLTFNYTTLDDFPEFYMESSTGMINFTPTSVGEHYVNVTAIDSHNASDLKIIYIEIKNNSHPHFNEIPPNVTKHSNETFYYAVNASDENGDEITYYVESIEDFPSLNINKTTGIMNFSLTKCDVGNHSVTITITDVYNASNSSSFLFEVINIPEPPILEELSDMHTRINKTFSIIISAEDNDILCPGDNLDFAINSTYGGLFSITNINSTKNYKSNFTAYSNIVGNYSINISVIDSYGLQDSVSINFSFTENHAPEINEDTITANASQNFSYLLNITDYDEDELTIEYSTDMTGFYMSPAGLINFTPLINETGTHVLYVNASDSIAISEKNITFIIITPNNPPILNVSNLNATAGINFDYQITAYDEDNDTLNFSYSFIGSNISNFFMNSSGFINFTPLDSEVGVYSLNISVSDGKSISYALINFTILWQNHNPKIIEYFPLYAETSEGQSIIFNVTINDSDLSYGDSITAVWRVDDALFNSTQKYSVGNYTYAVFNYSPGYCDYGTHNITILAYDSYGNSTWFSWNVTVNNTNRPPFFGMKILRSINDFSNAIRSNITLSNNSIELLNLENCSDCYNYSEFGYLEIAIDLRADNSNYAQFVFGKILLEGSISNVTNISIETRTSMDNITWSDWSLQQNNTKISSAPNRYLELRLNLSTTNNSISPKINNITIEYFISNLTIQENINPWWLNLNYFFYDEDISCRDDSLTFNSSLNSILGINIFNGLVQLQPVQDGTADIYFTATDSYNETANSNTARIIIENVEQITPQTIYVGGGTSSTIKEKYVDKPYSQNIIFPLEATIYQNDTIIIPLEIVNSGNETLEGITLEAFSERDVSMAFAKNSFEKIPKNSKERTELIVVSYKTYPSYEIVVKAKVKKPEFEDSAKILINSIELGSESEKEFNTKITFTRDLLRENPECLELNELLNKVEDYIRNKEYEKANAMIESTIRACKYLLTSKSPIKEKPARIIISRNYSTIAILFVVIAMLTLVIFYYVKRRFS